ncbi:SlyX family protein [Thiomicrospira cyclica]|uniref:Protein SlyX homolog n=1 Tax=Thiomicrospira cyclica (strain DSM 14477 / JCM 11371 / ALM1) TaxID=717773 RepID=F6DBQ5_THICA|nr:SlyX family protein [Thiomicrospira cyclica]AEG31291.1 Protein slyX [Thiomicrospira cyclica ALM1]
MDKNLVERLNELEILLVYQDDTLQATQQTLQIQQRQIQQLERQLQLLSEYLKSLKDPQVKAPNEETPPPHY